MSAGPKQEPVVAGSWTLALPRGRALRLHRRSALTAAALGLAALLSAAIATFTGEYHLSPMGVLRTLAGGGSATDRFFVLDQRLPRAVAAILVGTALGLSGALFQSLSRNPLGSPDIVGFTTGAASGGLVVILLTDVSSARSIAIGTMLGGLATALVVYLLSSARGIGGERLILIGIAVGAMLASLNDFLITRADIEAAETAKAWQFGSLNLMPWGHVTPLAIALAVLVPAALVFSRSLQILEMGDDSASALGVRTARVRTAVLLVAVLLAGAAVATAGPVSFLALAAPQLAARLARSPGISLLPSMAMGAVLLSLADLLSQRLLSPFQIPVGLVTGALGGAYLCWLIWWSGRQNT